MADNKQESGTTVALRKAGVPLTKDNWINRYFAGAQPKEGIGPELWAEMYSEMPDEIKAQKSQLYPSDPGSKDFSPE